MTERAKRRAVIKELMVGERFYDSGWAMDLLNYDEYGLISEGASRLARPEGFDPKRCKFFMAYCKAIGVYDDVVVRAAALRLEI